MAMTDDVVFLHTRLLQLEQQVRWQQRIGAVVALGLAGLLFAAFQAPAARTRFTEVDVERLNVVEPDGQPVMSIANTTRLPEPLIAGKTIKSGRKGPGIIFFDGKGWEVGGLTYSTTVRRDGSFAAGGHLSFDQYRNDQVVFLSYQDDGTHKRSGLYIVDRARTPTIEEIVKLDEAAKNSPEAQKAVEEKLRGAAAQRIFVGSDDETAMVRIRDRAGRDRLRMVVGPDGAPKLEFLDEAGKVVQALPGK
jgi:hypothetical protein